MAQIDQAKLYDVVVVGGGPAGLTAALYLARARYRVLVIEKEHFGGQITITAEVVNYPGIRKTDGAALTETMRQQAADFGAEFLLAEVEKLEAEGDIKTVRTSRGAFSCFGILVATGASPRMVGFPGEAEFRGHGVAYCATCDGEFFTGRDVFVVGGGFAAAEESVFLTKYARHVTILIRGNDFSCAEATAEAARKHEKITVLTHTQVESVSGGDSLEVLRYRNSETGAVTEYRPPEGETFGVFVFAGYSPATSLLQGIAELNPQGYVVTDRNQKTSAEGVYAAGDVCIKALRQVVTAVGDGAIAATELEKYAASMQAKTGLHPRILQAAAPSPKAEAAAPAAEPAAAAGLFDAGMQAQLNTVFSRMARPLVLDLCLNGQAVSAELQQYMNELASMTDRLTVTETADAVPEAARPCVRVCLADGTPTGLAFHGCPGGHEFTSFIMGLYNAAGPGQSLDDETTAAIAAIDSPLHMTILVSLSCTMCPELVMAAQKIASLNPNVTADIYDVNHFPALREKYKVMSVPCLVVNDNSVSFGRKNLKQLLDYLNT